MAPKCTKYVQVSSLGQIGRIIYVGSEMDKKSGESGMGHWKRKSEKSSIKSKIFELQMYNQLQSPDSFLI